MPPSAPAPSAALEAERAAAPTGAASALASDRPFVAFAATWLVLQLVALVPASVAPWVLAYRYDVVFLVLGAATATTLALTARSAAAVAERQALLLAAAAFGLWATQETIDVFFAEASSRGALAVLNTGLLLGFYLLFLLAVDVGRAGTDAPRISSARAVERLGVGLGILFLYLYWVALPAHFEGRFPLTRAPSPLFFELLDLALIVFVAIALRREPERRRQLAWRAALGAVVALALADLLTLTAGRGGWSFVDLPWTDPIWMLPHLLVVAAARTLVVLPAGERRPPAEELAVPTGRVSLLFLLLMAHAAAHLLDLRWAGAPEAEAAMARNWLELGALAILGPLAAVHQHLLERTVDRMRREVLEGRVRLEASRRLDALGRLAGGVAHDFGNDLQVILGYTARLLDGEPDPARRRQLGAVRTAAERAAALNAELLAVGRAPARPAAPLGLDAAIGALLPRLREVAGETVGVTFTPGAAGAEVAFGPLQLERVLVNLAANARDAMPEGGRLALTTAWRSLGPAGAAGFEERVAAGEYAELSIADSGAGMDRETLDRLFEPFFTTKGPERGNGLGLIVVQGLIRRAGGHVRAESAPGRGTRFEILLPIAGAAEPPALEAAVPIP
jgi:signal transduction histidine kinase